VFNIGPLELVVLALVGIIVLGPDRIPGVARDAARMIRQLRDMATGARSQLKNELGPEFADVGLDSLRELRSLNPRTAIQRALLGDDDEDVQGLRADAPSSDAPAAVPPAQQPLGRGDKAPFDEDAT
jgi:sec-independent protein translocase protein TatB